MTDKFYNAMGLCRRAGKLCAGHDEVKEFLRNGRAKLIILTSDASARLENEMRGLSKGVEIIRTDASMNDMEGHMGKHSGIFAVTDDGLKNLALSTIKEDSIYGTN